MTGSMGRIGAQNARRYGLARQHQDQHRALRRRYLREQRLAGVARVAFFVSAGAFFAWASPFLPHGLDLRSYAGPAALAAGFGSMAVLFWLNSTLLSFRARGRRRIMAPWQSMFDDETGIYNRAYFMDTLELELARARDNGAAVGVYLVQAARLLPKGEATRLTAEDADAVIASVNGMLGRDDLLATLRPDEFAALILDGDGSVTGDALASGLLEALERSRPGEAYRVRIGHAESGPARDGRSIIDAARADMRASRVALIGAA